MQTIHHRQIKIIGTIGIPGQHREGLIGLSPVIQHDSGIIEHLITGITVDRYDGGQIRTA